MLLRPADVPPTRLGWLPLLTGVAVAAAVRDEAGVPASLKWPNDVLVGERKLAGILAEAHGDAIVVGVGLNVTLSQAELPVPTATSLLIEDAASTDRAALLAAILTELARRYRAWRTDPDARRPARGLPALVRDDRPGGPGRTARRRGAHRHRRRTWTTRAGWCCAPPVGWSRWAPATWCTSADVRTRVGMLSWPGSMPPCALCARRICSPKGSGACCGCTRTGRPSCGRFCCSSWCWPRYGALVYFRGHVPPPAFLGSGVLAIIVLLIGVAIPVLRWQTTTYELTTRRLRLRRGILSRSGRDFPLIRISDVSFSHGLIDRLLGAGTLIVESAGEHGQLVLTEIPHVEVVQATLFQLVEDEQQRLAQDEP